MLLGKAVGEGEISMQTRSHLNALFLLVLPLGPWRLARLSNQETTDDGCCRGSGALRWVNPANGGGGARSGAAGPRCRVASTLR
jgi:hypothetical protein